MSRARIGFDECSISHSSSDRDCRILLNDQRMERVEYAFITIEDGCITIEIQGINPRKGSHKKIKFSKKVDGNEYVSWGFNLPMAKYMTDQIPCRRYEIDADESSEDLIKIYYLEQL